MLEKTNKGIIMNIMVKPKSKHFKIKFSEIGVTVFCKSPPIRGKANIEIINEFTKIFGHKVIIIEGHKSNNKKIFLEGFTLENTISVLNNISQ